MILDGITFAERLRAAGVPVPDNTIRIEVQAEPDSVALVVYTVGLDDTVADIACEAARSARAMSLHIDATPHDSGSDRVDLSNEARTVNRDSSSMHISSPPRPGPISRALGWLADRATAFLEAWGEWWGGSRFDQIE